MLAEEETRAAEFRALQARRCQAKAARAAQLRGSESAYQGLLARTEAIRRGNNGYEEECTDEGQPFGN